MTKLKENLIIFVISITIGLVVTGFNTNPTLEKTTQDKIASNILRLHILANSNTTYDQHIKLLVRDAVLDKMATLSDGATDIQNITKILNTHLDSIVETANSVLIDNGQKPTASAQITNLYFPEIEYGDITMPSGYYNSLQITLGTAQGKNWWCVMFPMLCFIDNEKGESTEEMRDYFREFLSEEEFESLFNIRFKSLELLESLF